jgi:hypothetical protein
MLERLAMKYAQTPVLCRAQFTRTASQLLKRTKFPHTWHPPSHYLRFLFVLPMLSEVSLTVSLTTLVS